MNEARLFFISCESSLHCGCGSDVGVIDLPIQREKHTGFPKIESSSLKGAIREAFEESEKKITFGGKEIAVKESDTVNLVFGPDIGGDYAGALGFSDARLLLFPVRSMKGVFAWITCPLVIEKFLKDLKLCGESADLKTPSPNSVPQKSALFVKDNSNKVVFEEYTFDMTKDTDENGECTKLAKWLAINLFGVDKTESENSDIMKRLAVLSNEDFRDFVTMSTEVITRTKINNDTGTVQSGALFTEEYLPPETILYSLAFANRIFKEKKEEKGIFCETSEKKEAQLILEYFTEGMPEVMQIGGNATIGKGIVKITFIKKEGA
jgi:CRISPR-associated protein Cmr4